MVIENILSYEIGALNKSIIRHRKSLEQLLQDPYLLSKNGKLKLSRDCLERIKENCSLPVSEIMLPVTFFIPAGSYEGYLQMPRDAEIVEALGYELHRRGDRFWLAKHRIRELERKCPGVVQSVLLP